MKQHPKEAILATARKFFARRGFKESTVRDIASAACVNMGMISYYFGGKKELYQACIESSGLHKQGIARSILKPCTGIETFRARLEIFVEEFLAAHAQDQDSAKIISRESEGNTEIFQTVLESVFKETFHLIHQYFSMGMKEGFLNPDLDPAEVATLFHGCLLHQSKIDAIRQSWTGQTFQDLATRKHIGLQLTKVFLDGIIVGESRVIINDKT